MSEDKTKELDPSFLSVEEKEKIKIQVEKEIELEAKKKAQADYKANLMAAAKKKALMRDAKEGENGDGLVSIFIDLPSVAECIRLDGTAFYPGRTYNVLPAVRDTLLEIMYRGKEHEDEVSGKKEKDRAHLNKQHLKSRI